MIVCRELTKYEDRICKGLESYKRVLSFGNDVKIVWCINHSFVDDPYFNHETFWTSKERFIDWLSDKYPDHFEWLLWHPEWFEGRND